MTRDEFIALPAAEDYEIGATVLVWIGRGGKTAVPAQIEHISHNGETLDYHLTYADTDGFTGHAIQSQTVKTARLIRPVPPTTA